VGGSVLTTQWLKKFEGDRNKIQRKMKGKVGENEGFLFNRYRV
jgi:hypothetical protein